MDRGTRRHRTENIKTKRKSYQIFQDWPDGHTKNWKHPKKCSCNMCGNPRRIGHKTKQELSSDEGATS